jgi:hypothetical protein
MTDPDKTYDLPRVKGAASRRLGRPLKRDGVVWEVDDLGDRTVRSGRLPPVPVHRRPLQGETVKQFANR